MTELEEAQKQLQDVQAKIDKLVEEQNRSKKWEWSYDRKRYSVGITSTHSIEYADIDITRIEHGRYRRTKEQAEYSLLRNKRANRLEALAMEIGGVYEGDDGYYVFMESGKWSPSWNSHAFHPEKVYMSKDTAIEVCSLLNEGLYSLKGEL